MTNRRIQAIIPCAGIGSRLKTHKSKPFVDLCGQPILIHSLKAFNDTKVDSIILVVHKDEMNNINQLLNQYDLKKDIDVVVGGDTRSQSVSNGLKVIHNATDIVLIHDAARPLITADLIDQAIEMCITKEAVIIGVPLKSTIKCIKNGVVEKTLDRTMLYDIQTPQVFKKNLLVQAHKLPEKDEVTDDSMLLERMGYSVYIIEGSYRNIKITNIEDLIMAEAFLKG